MAKQNNKSNDEIDEKTGCGCITVATFFILLFIYKRPSDPVIFILQIIKNTIIATVAFVIIKSIISLVINRKKDNAESNSSDVWYVVAVVLIIVAYLMLRSIKSIALRVIFASVVIIIVSIFAFSKRENHGSEEEQIEKYKKIAVLTREKPKKESVDYLMFLIDSLTEERSSLNAGTIFEEICKIILENHGFVNVVRTPPSGDNGVDIVAEYQGEKYAVQCKCYRKNVSNKAIQEVYTGKEVYHCEYAVVLTNSYFSESAIQAGDATHVGLWDRDVLLKSLNVMGENKIKKMIDLCLTAPKYDYK